MFNNAVFQGGGVKGIALVGALDKIEELGIKFNAVSGTSAGSIVAALYSAGYSAREMRKILDDTDFSTLLDPFKFKYLRLPRNRGLYKGEKLFNWIHYHLAKRGVYFFSDLGAIDLKIVASDITNRELIVFEKNTHPNLKVAEAVRMSASIPFFFSPVQFGEKTVIDGGVLSNYPLFTFNDPSNTLGFKIVPESKPVPQKPSSVYGFLMSMTNTMMEARDKNDEGRQKHTNFIPIDDAGISSIKFSLTKEEKNALYQNGYYAASKFVVDNSAALRKASIPCIKIEAPAASGFEVEVPNGMEASESIRVSISALVRIFIDGKYLLVKGNRIDQFQPVGGVLKRFPMAQQLLDELSVTEDDKLPIDNSSRDDLRIRVPLTSLSKFLEWYVSGKDREMSPWREFYEELIESKILSAGLFRYIRYQHIRRHVEGIRFSPHFGCNELLVAEVFDFIPEHDQLVELRKLQKDSELSTQWFARDVILARGFDSNDKKDMARIAENAEWIL